MTKEKFLNDKIEQYKFDILNIPKRIPRKMKKRMNKQGYRYVPYKINEI